MANSIFILNKNIRNHTNGGTVLMAATALALLVVNLPSFTTFTIVCGLMRLRCRSATSTFSVIMVIPCR